jgi:hypothetical protein
MKRGLKHIVTSWLVLVSFVTYSVVIPTVAYAEGSDAPPVSAPNLSCELIGLSGLSLTSPTLRLGNSSGSGLYDIGSRYKIFDTTTSQQLDLEGTFLTRPVAASLLVSLQNIESLWQVELNRILSYNNACWQYRLSISQAEVISRDHQIITLNEQTATRLAIRDDQINFLSENLQPKKWYEAGEFWFAVGLVGGVLVTVAAGHALSQVN